MAQTIKVSVLIVAMCLFYCGCAATRVVKNPSEDDQGIRYYRPKPYLFLQPVEGTDDKHVSIGLQYLPDFAEEYSIHVRAGLGINNTKVTLTEGWNLTQLDSEIDQNFDDNLTAVTNLAKGLLPQPSGETKSKSMVVQATNVPYGFYESVVSKGRDGKKRLYGWRYVGFHPFNNCPIESGGEDCADCTSGEIFGLTFEKGVMVFKPISQIALGADPTHIRIEPSVTNPEIGETLESIAEAAAFAAMALDPTLALVQDKNVTVKTLANRTIEVTIELPGISAQQISDNQRNEIKRHVLDEVHRIDPNVPVEVEIKST